MRCQRLHNSSGTSGIITKPYPYSSSCVQRSYKFQSPSRPVRHTRIRQTLAKTATHKRDVSSGDLSKAPFTSAPRVVGYCAVISPLL